MNNRRKNIISNKNFISNSNGITLIVLVITISIIIMISGVVIYEARYLLNQNYQKNEITKLQLIQVKLKTMREEIEFNNDETLLKGIKYKDLQDESIKNNIDTLFNTQEFENLNKEEFYYLNQSAFDEMNLESIKKYENKGYLVNYNTCDVVILAGIKLSDGSMMYKFENELEKNKYYIVEYNANGGEGIIENSVYQYNEEKALTANTFIKEGYIFKNWNTKADGTGINYKNEQIVKNLTKENGKVITLYAQWGKSTYTIAFNSNGGTGTMASIEEIKYTESKELTANTFTKTGYTFAGWNTKADGTGTNYEDKAVVSKLASGGTVTLYAKWIENTYTIAFDSNGGTGTMASIEGVKYTESKALIANTYTKEGYTFAGWNTKADGTGTNYEDKASVSKLASSGTVTLYAKWAENTYTIAFDSNGGTGTMASIEGVKYTESKALIANTYTKEGYTFAGWNTKADGTGTNYEDKASVSKLASSGTVTLYAKWAENTYTIAFDSNGGTGTMASIEGVKYTESKALIANTYTKEGYTFAGWNTKADGTGTNYEDKASVSKLATSGTVTLYAKWKIIQYTVTYNANGGTVSPASATVNYNTATTLPKPTRTGYIFTGWYTATSGGTKIGDAGASYKPSSNITIYAQWQQANGIVPAVKEVSTSGLTTSTVSSLTRNENRTFIVNGITYEAVIYYFPENVTVTGTLTLGNSSDVATSSAEAKNMVVAIFEKDLTVNSGATITAAASSSGYGGPKGMYLCVKGTLTNNGTITMTARGAKATGENVYLYSSDSTWNAEEYVPAIGGAGGESKGIAAGATRGSGSGDPGKSSTSARGTGGGGSGGFWNRDNNYATYSGAGGKGTSYSGGTGGGAAQTVINYYGAESIGNSNGGTGGHAFCHLSTSTSSASVKYSAGGGAGNPGGQGRYSYGYNGTPKNEHEGAGDGENGTGGLLIIYGNKITNNGAISSEGKSGGVLSSSWPSGGSSGGGSINIYYKTTIAEGTVSIIGGASKSGNGAGGKGGNGSYTCTKLEF